MQVICMTIYIDVVFLENLVMNSIILIASGIILKKKMKWIRILLASSLGAIYTIIGYISTLEIYSNLLLKIILSILIIYIAFNPQTVKQMWKDILIFYLTSFVFGGVAFALIYVVKPQDILMKNGLFLGTYPLKTVLLAAIVAFIIIIAAFAIVKTKFSKKDMFCDVKIELNNKKIETKAMIDTGNLLKEPITNTPVIVLEHTLLYECIPREILDNLEKILGGDLTKIPDDIRNEYIPRLKLIPFASLGKQNGMLVGIKADSLKIIHDDQEKENKNVIIGIYNKSLTKRGEYRALIGIDLVGSKIIIIVATSNFIVKFV